MTIKEMLINWIFKGLRLKKSIINDYLDEMDADNDGFIDLAEFVRTLKRIKART